jgi:hypothetical protein
LGKTLSEFVQRTIAKVAPPLAFVACAALSATLFVEYTLAAKFVNDFGVYWRTANQPVEMAYLWQGRFPFPYMPTMLLWIAPLSAIPQLPAYLFFIVFSTVAFVLACRPYLSNAAIALALVSPPFLRGLYTGQVSAILAALLLWACGTRNRVAAGIAFGLIASIKPQLVIMAPLMLALTRDWKALIAAAVTFLSVVLLSVVAFGPERWPEWIASMDHFHRAVTGTNVIDSAPTPAAIAVRFGLPPMPFLLIGAIGGAVTVYLCREMPALERATAIAIGSLLAAPYALAYDLITIVPFLVGVIFRGRIMAVVAILATLHPLPLAVSTYELLRKAVRVPKLLPYARRVDRP